LPPIFQTQLQLLPYLRLNIFRNLALLYLHYEVFTARAVPLSRRDFGGLLIARLHADDSLLKAFNHLPLTYSKPEGFLPFARRVEHRSIFEFSGVMNFYGVSLLYSSHVSVGVI